MPCFRGSRGCCSGGRGPRGGGELDQAPGPAVAEPAPQPEEGARVQPPRGPAGPLLLSLHAVQDLPAGGPSGMGTPQTLLCHRRIDRGVSPP